MRVFAALEAAGAGRLVGAGFSIAVERDGPLVRVSLMRLSRSEDGSVQCDSEECTFGSGEDPGVVRERLSEWVRRAEAMPEPEPVDYPASWSIPLPVREIEGEG